MALACGSPLKADELGGFRTVGEVWRRGRRRPADKWVGILADLDALKEEARKAMMR